MTWKAEQFAAQDFVRRLGPPPSQTGKMTKAKLAALIKAGYGQNHFHRYKPWLRTTKRDLSPNSVVGHLPGVDLGRLHHTRSIAERCTIQIAKWLGAVDVREAYPAWPFPHAHPGDGLPGFEDAPRQRGLLEISRESGIRHGVYPGTGIPYVATIDVLGTWRDESGRHSLVAFENKPEDIVFGPLEHWRAKERLELTRRYCGEASIPHRIIHAEHLPSELRANIDAIEPRLTRPRRLEISASGVYRDVVEQLNLHGYQTPINDILDRLRTDRGYDDVRLTEALFLALWQQEIDHDLSLPLRLWEPLKTGGRAIRSALLSQWVEAP